MSDDAARIAELERGFRRDGLPNLILDFSAAEDVFTRAIPFLSLVFVLEIVNAMDLEASAWVNLLFALGGAAILFGAFGALNVARGRPFLSVPSRVERPELAAFVVLPGLLPIVFSGQWLFGFNTMLVNAALLVLVYLVIGFGVVSLVRWTGRRFFAQLGASLSVLVRAVPLLLFFSLVMFFTTEIWQVFTTPGPGAFWTAMIIFVLLAMVFLAVRLPGVVREVQAESSVGEVPLRPKERLNLAAVALISEMLQVVFVSTAIWLFYVVLGALLVNDAVRQTWLLTPDDVYFTITWFGDDVQVNEALLRVATGVAAFAGLYYAVTILVDAAYRDQFVDSLTVELRDTFRRRSEYLELQRKRGVPVTPPTDPTAGTSAGT
ncbi:MAG TPA: hypothetical protein VIX39_02245 [Actinomycetota bacterium]